MSAIYHAFARRAFVDGFFGSGVSAVNPTWGAMLVGPGYTFDAAHDSVSTDIAADALGSTLSLQAVGTPVESSAIPGLTTPQGFKLGPFQDTDLVWTDGPPLDAYPAGALAAVVIYMADEPLLYLDGDSFPDLPATTLGGAVEWPNVTTGDGITGYVTEKLITLGP